MMDLYTARELLAEHVAPLPAVELDLVRAAGCRLAQTPHADLDLPAADVSMMDGYAVRAADVARGAALPVAFEVPAGRAPRELPSGSAARIFTGAEIPAGADTVVPQEQARAQTDAWVLLDELPCGSFVRHRAELCSAGAPLGVPGDVITPQMVALLGTAGASRVRVIPRPRVAVLSTGSELVPIQERPAAGQIRDSNRAMLVALAGAAGFDLAGATAVADDLPALHAALRRASAGADLVVTCGGVSVGDYDLVPRALSELGGETLFHKLSIKPGKPILAARLGRGWVVGLPGNPVSALVGWRMFVRPLGARLAGDRRAFEESPLPAVLTRPAGNSGDRTALAPAVLEPGHPVARLTVLPLKGSHDVVTAARANALAILEVGADLAAGAEARCYRLDGGAAPCPR